MFMAVLGCFNTTLVFSFKMLGRDLLQVMICLTWMCCVLCVAYMCQLASVEKGKVWTAHEAKVIQENTHTTTKHQVRAAN
jgi:hypothetical protein